MKKLILLAAALLVGSTYALDNEAWLNKARECVEARTLMDCDETPEDGVYCLVMAVIKSTPDKSADVLVQGGRGRAGGKEEAHGLRPWRDDVRIDYFEPKFSYRVR